MKKIPFEDQRVIATFIIIGASLPLQAFRAGPDPLSNTLFSIRGGHSGVVPYALGCVYGFVALFWVRRISPSKPGLIFCAGMLLGLIPALFYACTAPLWTASPPIGWLTIIGLIVGTVEGASAVRYFRAAS